MIIFDAALLRDLQNGSIFRNEPNTAGRKCAFWIVVQAAYAHFESVWQEAIVRIKENQIVSPAFPETDIACSAHALILLPYQTNARVRRRHIRRVVGRSVVNNNDFRALIRLTQSALNGIVQERTAVVTRDYNGDKLTGFHVSGLKPWSNDLQLNAIDSST
jgi:hypothetical protein